MIQKTLVLAVLISGAVLAAGLAGASCNGSQNAQLSPACASKPDIGPCRALMVRYYFDASENECRSFNWGGCEGNVPFETMDSCKAACE